LELLLRILLHWALLLGVVELLLSGRLLKLLILFRNINIYIILVRILSLYWILRNLYLSKILKLLREIRLLHRNLLIEIRLLLRLQVICVHIIHLLWRLIHIFHVPSKAIASLTPLASEALASKLIISHRRLIYLLIIALRHALRNRLVRKFMSSLIYSRQRYSGF